MKPDFDDERAFGGLRRLYGAGGYTRVRQARVAVVGVGGVGSWAVEALARSGVAALVLFDLDHVSESNINRQLQATTTSLGQAKVQALRERIVLIHPGCEVHAVEAFVTPENWPNILPLSVDAVIDACDQSAAKRALAAWALGSGTPFVCVGAAGGKQQATRVAAADLAMTTHDPLLAGLRQRLRRDGLAPRQGPIGLRCIYSDESVQAPLPALEGAACEPARADLSCHGYGSSVVVTATFGMAAAGECIRLLLEN
ncbi:MAG: hypothetical protein RIR43_1676 [Pseudomonadota bacterium]